MHLKTLLFISVPLTTYSSDFFLNLLYCALKPKLTNLLQSDYFSFSKDDFLYAISSLPHKLSYTGPSLGIFQVFSDSCMFGLCSRHGCTDLILLTLPFSFSLASCLILYTILPFEIKYNYTGGARLLLLLQKHWNSVYYGHCYWVSLLLTFWIHPTLRNKTKAVFFKSFLSHHTIKRSLIIPKICITNEYNLANISSTPKWWQGPYL